MQHEVRDAVVSGVGTPPDLILIQLTDAVTDSVEGFVQQVLELAECR